MEINKLFIRDKGQCLTPVYLPGESYSFFVNADVPFTDPQPQLLDLVIVDSTNTIIEQSFAVKQVFHPYGPLAVPFLLAYTFAFPQIQNGQYRFAIYSYGDSIIHLTSNVILVENQITDTTAFCEFRNSVNKYGILYEDSANFKNRFRLPVAQVDLQYASDRKQYRNVTDRKLRNIVSYRDAVLKLQAVKFDDDGHEAFSAMLEHDYVMIEGYELEPKSALTIDANQAHSLRNGTVEVYVSNPDDQYGFWNGYGGTIIYSGTPGFSPEVIYEP